MLLARLQPLENIFTTRPPLRIDGIKIIPGRSSVIPAQPSGLVLCSMTPPERASCELPLQSV
jgi:hypothetical protein